MTETRSGSRFWSPVWTDRGADGVTADESQQQRLCSLAGEDSILCLLFCFASFSPSSVLFCLDPGCTFSYKLDPNTSPNTSRKPVP